MRVHELLCFGLRSGEGNAALVVEHDHSSPAGRQAFAAAQQRSACVFLDADDDPAAPLQLDYYYPHTRSPLCLHATLAAAHMLFAQKGTRESVDVRTAMRGQWLPLHRRDGAIFVALSAQAAPAVAITPDLPPALFGAIDIVSAPLVASVGSAKLLLEVKDKAALYALRPDLERISDWSRQNGVNGCYVYCRLGDDQYEGRNFNHLDPRGEDSATGVAAGALTVHLGRGLTLLQGSATGQSCVMRTRIDGETILVGGATELRAESHVQ
jgi:PhzF family phenazine biosynthesis protein